MNQNRIPMLPAGFRLAAALMCAAATATAATTTFFSFEDGTTQGWAVNAASWANGFSTLAVAGEHATDGSKSLKIDFTGQSFKWGGFAENYANPAFLEAIKPGGKLFLDVFIPESSAGISQLGFVIQQPDVTGDKNWQQVWFWIGGATGSFTVELPFERLGSGPVNLHLGQNATADAPFTVFVDNLRLEPDPPVGPAPITLQTFEDGTTHGWVLNNDWGKGFATLENAAGTATEGTRALKVTFPGDAWKWGAYNLNLTDPSLLEAIQYGGKFLFDLVVPADSDGIQNLGFSFQQAGVEGALGWQQIWYGVNGQTGTFTMELPFLRTSGGAVHFNLGHNSTPDKTYTAYLDNLRVVPNPPPPQGITRTNVTPLFSFEDGTAEGFEINSQGWGLAFATVEPAEGNATHGSKSLKTTFPAGDFKWGAFANNITRPDVLSAVSENGTLLVDVFIPETSSTIQHLGVSLSQPGATGGKDWQQVWFFVGGQTGRFTVDLPFTRENDKAIYLNLGRNSTGDTDAEVYFDNFRVQTTELVGATVGTAKATGVTGGKVKLEFTGTLEAADSPAGPFQTVVGATSPREVDPAAVGDQKFYRTQGQPIVFLSDDFEGANAGWTVRYVAGSGAAPAWELGTPAYPDEVTFAHSGTKVWATSLTSPYADGVTVALTSPVIDLANASTGVRLSFYDLLDAGGTEGDGDQVEVFVRAENGGVLAGAEGAVWTGKRSSAGPYFFQRRVVDLPSVANGKKVKLEFRLTSDASGAGLQKGWFVDDVSVYAKP